MYFGFSISNMGFCCSVPLEDNYPNISAAETMLDSLAGKRRPQEPSVSIQGPNPLTFQNVTLSDTSSDIDEALIAEMTKSDDEDVKPLHKKKSKHSK